MQIMLTNDDLNNGAVVIAQYAKPRAFVSSCQPPRLVGVLDASIIFLIIYGWIAVIPQAPTGDSGVKVEKRQHKALDQGRRCDG